MTSSNLQQAYRPTLLNQTSHSRGNARLWLAPYWPMRAARHVATQTRSQCVLIYRYLCIKHRNIIPLQEAAERFVYGFSSQFLVFSQRTLNSVVLTFVISVQTSRSNRFAYYNYPFLLGLFSYI